MPTLFITIHGENNEELRESLAIAAKDIDSDLSHFKYPNCIAPTERFEFCTLKNTYKYMANLIDAIKDGTWD